MKNLNQKIFLLLIIILIALCSLFIFQWNKEKEKSNVLNSVQEKMVYRNFTYLTKKLNDVAETLDYYHEEFTEQERGLFLKALSNSDMSLDETDSNLNTLLSPNLPSNLGISVDQFLYEQQVWEIQYILREIKSGHISSQNEILLISSVIKKQNEKLSDMFYGEKQLGVGGINTKEEIVNAIEIIDLMNEEIKEVISK